MATAKVAAATSTIAAPNFYVPFRTVDLPLKVLGLSRAYRDSRKSTLRGILQLIYQIVTLGFVALLLLAETTFVYKALPTLSFAYFAPTTILVSKYVMCMISFAKVASLACHRTTYRRLADGLAALHDTAHYDKEDVELVKRRYARIRMVMMAYATVVILYGIVVTLLPAAMAGYIHGMSGQLQLELPFDLYYPFNPMSSYSMVGMIYALQVVAGFLLYIGWICFDCMYCIYLVQLSMQFELIQRKISNVGVHNVEELSDDQLSEMGIYKLKQIIHRHNELLSLCRIVKRLFAFPFFMNILAGILLGCALLFSFLMSPLSMLHQLILPFIVLLVQFLLISFYGEKLKKASMNVALVAYETIWTDLSVGFQKLIIPLMNMGYRYEYVTATAISELSMSTFAFILKFLFFTFIIIMTLFYKFLKER